MRVAPVFPRDAVSVRKVRMRRWSVGDECWTFVYDEQAACFVPGLFGYVVGIQCLGFVVGSRAPMGIVCVHVRFGDRLFHSAREARAQGMSVTELAPHRYRTAWIA